MVQVHSGNETGPYTYQNLLDRLPAGSGTRVPLPQIELKRDFVPMLDQDDALLREVTVTSTDGYEKSRVISSAVLLVTSPRRM